MKHVRDNPEPAEPAEISDRQSEIAEIVRTNGFAAIDDLSERFSVSPQTIRKDVNLLCSFGLLRRTHGGVQPASPGNLVYGMRRVLRLTEKRRIAALVAARIPNGASLALSIGTTPEIVMQALGDHRDLRIFTNNLHVAMRALDNASFEVTVPGGRLRHGDGDVIGAAAEAFFAGYKVDFGIFGVAAVDEAGALLDFHEDEVTARRAVLENSTQSFLVLDHLKFDRRAHVRGGHITDVDAVFSDRDVPPGIAGLLIANKVALETAEGTGR